MLTLLTKVMHFNMATILTTTLNSPCLNNQVVSFCSANARRRLTIVLALGVVTA